MHCTAWDTYRSVSHQPHAEKITQYFFVRLRYANRTYYNHFFASDASIIFNVYILQFAYPQ
jgi:hypothetical protein